MTTTKARKPRSKWGRRFNFAFIVAEAAILCFGFNKLMTDAAIHQGWDANDWRIWAARFLIFGLGIAVIFLTAVLARRKSAAVRKEPQRLKTDIAPL